MYIYRERSKENLERNPTLQPYSKSNKKIQVDLWKTSNIEQWIKHIP